MTIVYDQSDKILGEFETLHDAEVFAHEMQNEMTVYIDTEYAFIEYPKKEF